MADEKFVTELADRLKEAGEKNLTVDRPTAMENLAEAIGGPVEDYVQQQVIEGVAGVTVKGVKDEIAVTPKRTEEGTVDYAVGLAPETKQAMADTAATATAAVAGVTAEAARAKAAEADLQAQINDSPARMTEVMGKAIANIILLA